MTGRRKPAPVQRSDALEGGGGGGVKKMLHAAALQALGSEAAEMR